MLNTVEQTSTLVRLRELSNQLTLLEHLSYNFFHRSPDLLAVITSDGFFQQINPMWQKILGWTVNEAMVQPWFYLIHPGDQPTVREAIGHLVDGDVHFMCRVHYRDGRYRAAEFSATQWCDGYSNLVGRLVSESCLNCPDASPRLGWRPYACNSRKDCEQQRRA